MVKLKDSNIPKSDCSNVRECPRCGTVFRRELKCPKCRGELQKVKSINDNIGNRELGD